MNLIQILSVLCFLTSNLSPLYANSDDEGEASSNSPPKKQSKTEYDQAFQWITNKFGDDIANRLLPKRFDTERETSSSYLYSSTTSPTNLYWLVANFTKEWVEYGLRTLLPDESLDFVYNHFDKIKLQANSASDKVETYLQAAQKIHFHRASDLKDVIQAISSIEGLEPQSTVALWDLHGTLTKVATPGYRETNAEARALATQLIEDTASAGITNIIVSAWDNIDEVIAQVRHLGLSEVFNIPEEYQIESDKKTIDGTTLYYVRVGNVISVKIEPYETYYRDKIYALDILGLSPETIIFVDDSPDNVWKAALHFARTQSSQNAKSFYNVYLGDFQKNEPNELSETDLQKWRTTLKIKE